MRDPAAFAAELNKQGLLR